MGGANWEEVWQTYVASKAVTVADNGDDAKINVTDYEVKGFLPKPCIVPNFGMGDACGWPLGYNNSLCVYPAPQNKSAPKQRDPPQKSNISHTPSTRRLQAAVELHVEPIRGRERAAGAAARGPPQRVLRAGVRGLQLLQQQPRGAHAKALLVARLSKPCVKFV